MQVLRTPDDRFVDLPGYPFAPHYAQVATVDGPDLRVHYLDEGPRDGRVVLCLHGEPSWSYLYRTMVPVLVAAGHRVIGPDLVGFGRSDKPAAGDDYTYERHVAWMAALLEQLGLSALTLVCQDWGGLIGLRLLAEDPGRFARLVVANTGLPTGDQPLGEAFDRWLAHSQRVERFPVGRFIDGATTSELPPAVIAAYDAPFPDESYKAGARVFPTLVPNRPDDPAAPANRAAWGVLARWPGPILTAFSDGDPITAGGERHFQRLPGAQGQPHVTITGGGHFLQEDRGPELARVVVDFMG